MLEIFTFIFHIIGTNERKKSIENFYIGFYLAGADTNERQNDKTKVATREKLETFS